MKWAGNGDWLGTGNIATRQREYRPFKEARAYARGLDLKGVAEWYDFCKGKLPETYVLLPVLLQRAVNILPGPTAPGMHINRAAFIKFAFGEWQDLKEVIFWYSCNIIINEEMKILTLSKKSELEELH